jgi:hypothetical protein
LPGFGNVTAIHALLLVCARPSPLLLQLRLVGGSEFFSHPFVYKGHKQAINNHRKTRSAAHSEPVAIGIAAASIKASVFSDSEVLPLPAGPAPARGRASHLSPGHFLDPRPTALLVAFILATAFFTLATSSHTSLIHLCNSHSSTPRCCDRSLKMGSIS